MFDSSSLPTLAQVISDHNLRAQKSLGQNFLLDQNITDKIARIALNRQKNIEDLTVFEIGPGPGGLTRSLLANPVKKVIAIEFDERAVRALQHLKQAAGDRLQIIQGDALRHNLLDLSDRPRAIVANLPYNIATPLLTGWLKQIRADKYAYTSMTLMFQKEVAHRITAVQGEKPYGRLGILSNWLCRTGRVYDLPPSAFTPPPKVSSSIVHFIPNDIDDNAPEFSNVEKITASAFGQRRKMIRTSLKAYVEHFEDLGITPTKRAEELVLADFLALAKTL